MAEESSSANRHRPAATLATLSWAGRVFYSTLVLAAAAGATGALFWSYGEKPPTPAASASQGSSPRRTVEFEYSFEVQDVPAGAEKVLVWIPLPPSDARQTISDLRIEGKGPGAGSVTRVTDPEYGNAFARFDLSEAARKGRPLTGSIRFTATRAAYRVVPLGTGKEQENEKAGSPFVAKAKEKSSGKSDATATAGQRLDRFLQPDHLVPLAQNIREEAQRIAGAAPTPLVRARLLYDHIVSTVSYDKSGQGWGRGDAVYACDIRKGNCTDFHSLFIGEARSLKLPARFIMGVPLPAGQTEGEISGYHCWAEFYLQDRGWTPLDASEACKHPEQIDALFGGLDANRIQFTVGRDITLPGSALGPVNFSIYPHVEVDGRLHEPVKRRFYFRDVSSSSALAPPPAGKQK